MGKSTTCLMRGAGAIAFSITACSNLGSHLGPSVEGTAWQLVSYNQVPALTDFAVTADFVDGQLSGSAGCNHYFGHYTLAEEQITITETAATEKFCSVPKGIMVQEAAYLALVRQAETYDVEGDRLTIETPAGDLRFTVADYVFEASSREH